jgi:hypothetical protein
MLKKKELNKIINLNDTTKGAESIHKSVMRDECKAHGAL